MTRHCCIALLAVQDAQSGSIRCRPNRGSGTPCWRPRDCHPVTAIVPALETHSDTTAASLARPMILFVSEVGQIERVGDELFAIAKFLRVGGRPRGPARAAHLVVRVRCAC